MRKDLQMTKGKMIAQGSHASLGVILQMMHTEEYETKAIKPQPRVKMSMSYSPGSPLDEWLNGVFKKVCVYVTSEEELDDIYNKARAAGLPVKMIVDSGLTMFHGVPTKTCLAIGPEEEEKIDAITGHLKLL
jgi:PTH2 family peptidyl-tRNA hydrolase